MTLLGRFRAFAKAGFTKVLKCHLTASHAGSNDTALTYVHGFTVREWLAQGHPSADLMVTINETIPTVLTNALLPVKCLIGVKPVFAEGLLSGVGG